MNEITNSADILLFICDILKDQNKPDEEYLLLNNNIDCEEYSDGILAIDIMFLKLEQKFGKRDYRAYFIDHFLKNSKSIDGTVDYDYESRNVEDFIAFAVVIDKLIKTYMRFIVPNDKLYFSAFMAVPECDCTGNRIVEKCILYNEFFADTGEEYNEDELDDFISNNIINKETCLQYDLVYCGLVKNRFKPFYRILFKQIVNDDEVYRTFEIPICFNLGWFLSPEFIQYIKHPYDYILNNAKPNSVLFDISI